MAVRVLMVDDDPVHLELSKRFLTRQSPEYEIIPAETPEQAMNLLLEQTFDAAVCDIDMGNEQPSGLDILEQVRSTGLDVPVIIFTGKSREEIAIQALNLGADYYIRKSSIKVESLYAELSYYILTSVEKRRTKRALAESEKRLRQSEANLAEAQRIARMGHWNWDIQNDKIQWSDEIYRIFGLKPQEFSATYEAFLSSVHAEDRESVRIAVDEAISEKKPYHIDHQVVRPDGKIVQVHEEGEVTYDDQGNATRMMGTVQEITEHSHHVSQLYNNALVGLFRMRLSDGLILECNDQFAETLGFEGKDTLVDGSSFFKDLLLQPKRWNQLKKDIRKEGRLVTELAVSPREGHRLWMRFSLSMWSEKGYIEGVMSDITEQKEALEMLKKQKEELSDFAHSMSHDLKNIFHNMMGFIELVEEEQDFRHLSRMRILLNETGEMVDHSVALADAGLIIEQKENVNLDSLVREVADSLVPDTVSYTQDKLPMTDADERKVAQIFRNLFDNAILHGKPEKIEVDLIDEGERFLITISNDGKAIPDIMRSKVFFRGYTTSKTGKGFGLAIVKRLVEAHGWSIKLLESRKTAFEITIPK